MHISLSRQDEQRHNVLPPSYTVVQGILKELNGHWNKKIYLKLIPKEDVPEGKPILDSVWTMKSKRLVPAQYVPYDLIFLYVSKIIYIS